MFKYIFALLSLGLALSKAQDFANPTVLDVAADGTFIYKSNTTDLNLTEDGTFLYESNATDPNYNSSHDEGYHIFTIDFERVHSPMIIVMWLFLACIGKIAFHMAPKLSHMLPESVILIGLGLIIGGLLVYANPDVDSRVSPLTADIFFLFLLPPIILDAGYFMPNRLFFDHIGTILSFAVIGTLWNAFTIGISLYAISTTGLFGNPEDFNSLHVLLFSSLISAVDPVAVLAVFEEIKVEEVLFILVFGESLLNDGVTVVLYHIFERYSEIGAANIVAVDILKGMVSFFTVALGGTLIGIVWGFFTAFVTRFTHEVTVIEPMFIFLMSYLSYLNAELFHFSGILAITFCGITMKNYTEQNITENSSITTKYAMKMLASSSETVIFLFLGVATVHGTDHAFNGWFIFFTILFCSVYRIIGVLILSAVCNKFRVQRIDFVQRFVMCYGGLRGAVAFALAITIDPQLITLAPTFVTTTIAMVYFTVFIQGITIKPLVDKLGVKRSSERDLNMNERLHEKTMDYIMTVVEEIVGKVGKNHMRGWFKRVNNKYLQPRLVRNQHAREPKLFETLSKLKMEDAKKYIRDGHITDIEALNRVLYPNMNLDVGEIEYKPNDRDNIESQFHHLLDGQNAANNQRRQSTYKRHAVKDSDLIIPSNFEIKMALQARQVAMSGIRNRKSRKLGGQLSSSSIKKPSITRVNGVDVQLQNDYLHKSAFTNESYLDDNGLVMKETPSGNPSIKITTEKQRKMSSRGPTAAESMLPWKRFNPDECPTKNSEVRRASRIPYDDEWDSPQALAELVLPWKRNEDDWEHESQKTLPTWIASRSDSYYSSSNTILDLGILDENQLSSDRSSRRTSIDDMPSLRNSAKDDIYRRRSSLKDDPSMRRVSMGDFLDPRKAHPTIGGLRQRSYDPILNSGKSNESFLQTVIREEEPSNSQKNDDTPHNANSNADSDNTRV